MDPIIMICLSFLPVSYISSHLFTPDMLQHTLDFDWILIKVPIQWILIRFYWIAELRLPITHIYVLRKRVTESKCITHTYFESIIMLYPRGAHKGLSAVVTISGAVGWAVIGLPSPGS